MQANQVASTITALTILGSLGFAQAPTQPAPNLVFEENLGQTAAPTEFLARTGGVDLAFHGAAVDLHTPAGTTHLALSGARATHLRAESPLPSYSNYLLGNDRARWLTHVPHAAQLRATDVLPGVDLVWHRDGSRLEYDFHLAAGIDPATLVLEIGADDRLRTDAEGRLLHGPAAAPMIHELPVAWQDIGGTRHPVTATYRRIDDRHFGFDIGAHDPAQPLTIDPILSFSTFLGGSGYDILTDMARDSAGNLVVLGATMSTNFPVANGLQMTYAGGSYDLFVTKLSADGSTILWSTFFGGSMVEAVSNNNLALDANDRVFFSGSTNSTNFPTTPGAYQTTFGGAMDCFVSVLSADGSQLQYSTYVGGAGSEQACGMAVWNDSVAYVTTSANNTFPTTPGAYRTAVSGSNDAALFALATLGGGASDLLYSTFLGGAGTDSGIAVAVDAVGNAHMLGATQLSKGLARIPITPNAFHTGATTTQSTTYSVHYYAEIAPLGQGSSDLLYCSILENNLASAAIGFGDVAVGADGRAYMTGAVGDTGFPTTSNGFQRTIGGSTDAFLMVIDPSLWGAPSLYYSTYLGGVGADQGSGLCFGNGLVHLTGSSVKATGTKQFPVTGNALQTANAGAADVFITSLDLTQAGAAQLHYSTLFGSTGNEYGRGIAVTTTGGLAVAGYTGSTGFSTTVGAFDRTYNGGVFDGFVLRIE